MRRVAAALIHYPVYDRARTIVTTAITNLDLHDIARSALTFGLTDFFVVHPIAAQRTLAQRVKDHWVQGSGARRIPDRSPALGILRIVDTLEAAVNALSPDTELWVTSARAAPHCLTFSEARQRIKQPGAPVLICFGTGWGLSDSVTQAAAQRLEPVSSPRADGYNHLSVRAAAAIIFDRILGVPRAS